MKIAICQINPILGDLDYNKQLILEYYHKAMQNNADMAVFPEMAICGYPLNDLIFQNDLISSQIEILESLSRELNKQTALICGFVEIRNNNRFNSACLLQKSREIQIARKTLLPNYDVFHEKRYFSANDEIQPLLWDINNQQIRIGLHICEDLWDGDYAIKVVDTLNQNGADFFINISASPFRKDKSEERLRLASEKVKKFKKAFVYVNLVGAQDELVFDGGSFILDNANNCIATAKTFSEDFQVSELENQTPVTINPLNKPAQIYQALVLGIRDYFYKNNLQKAILGLSGGIDSAVVACLAVNALGAENVTAVAMPSQYSSTDSLNDAQKLAVNLNIPLKVISLEKFHSLFRNESVNWYQNKELGAEDENLQSRLRGTILMHLSNKEGYTVLSTGNKTEIALGYCTLYGDTNGALSPIGDLNKTEVYQLAHYINSLSTHEIIPENIRIKKPTAELRDKQFDPFDYDKISPIVDAIIEHSLSKNECLRLYPELSIAELEDIYQRIYSNEFKRFQSNIILKVSQKSFGYGRLYPITHHYRG